MTPERLAELDALALAATRVYHGCLEDLIVVNADGDGHYDVSTRSEADSQFYGTARDIVPELTAEVQQLWAERGDLRNRLDAANAEVAELRVVKQRLEWELAKEKADYWELQREEDIGYYAYVRPDTLVELEAARTALAQLTPPATPTAGKDADKS